MATKFLNQLLKRLDLLSNHCIFYPSKKHRLSPDFPLEVNNKLLLIKPDAYYSFNNQPYILFFDLSLEVNLERENEIHKQVWSFDSSPIIFIIKKGDIEVFNAFFYQKETKRLEKLNVGTDEIIKRFSFWNIQSGNTWKWLQTEKYYDTINTKRVNQRLFDNIKEARFHLEKTGLSLTDSNITILRLIFIRYLIDRGVGIKKEFIFGDSILERRQCFSNLILEPSRLMDFFEYLNSRFNGALFQQKSSFKLKDEQSKFLSQVFDVRKDKTTSTLFDIYYFDVFDFSIIPVEVISGIYESVIDQETREMDSAVYTPPFLVEYILTQTIDKFLQKPKNGECRVLDPACGSGIFLVQSYRRMVDKELKKSKNHFIESSRLRDIAENNLFGIDLNVQALLVASFSIYIAILDYKEPKHINTFIFPNLIGKNLFNANYFDVNHEYNELFNKIHFDFILGNPPWKSKKDDPFHLEYIKSKSLVIGRYEVAQTFLMRSGEFMSEKTVSSLIITSTIFYNISRKTKLFKSQFLTRFELETFFDLSAVRKLVFESAISPASIVIFKKARQNPDFRNIVEHYSVKSNIFLKYFQTLVIEKFDRKTIMQKYFIEYDWMFKVALYGNTLDFNFLKRLSEIPVKLLDLFDGNIRFKGAGIERGQDSKPYKELEGLPIIENNSINDYYTSIDLNKKLKKEETYLSRGRRIEIFTGERILLKEQNRDESNPVISYLSNSAVFRKGSFGISSVNPEEIKKIYAYLISDLYTYFLFITSCSWGVGTRPAIRLDEEYLSFPFIELSSQKSKIILQYVQDFLSPFINYYNDNLRSPSLPINQNLLNKINDVIYELYDVSKLEKNLINYVLEVSRYQFQEGKQLKLLKKINNDFSQLTKYAEVFFTEFEDIYEGEFLTADIYSLNYFIAINFKLIRNKPIKSDRINIISDITDEAKVLNALSSSLTIWSLTDSSDAKRNIFIQKDLKGFESDSFYIIKPNEYKCWHEAIAWYDLAEVKSAMESAELESLNKKK